MWVPDPDLQPRNINGATESVVWFISVFQKHLFRVYQALRTLSSIRKTMAFWGVEVKPGKPFTHKFDDLKGRLHISMATLGLGAATAKSILQCNVGNSSPVYICSLSSKMGESLQLNLEFEEVDEVVFSVIGARSIHLCGYYLGSGRITNMNEESESYGEDIANTESERSDCSDEDEYEDSFIDDDANPEAYPPSPLSNKEEASHTKKQKGSRRRLQRKYQRVESDDDKSFEDNVVVISNERDQTKTTKDEDNLPISSLCKGKVTARVLFREMDVTDDRRADDNKKNGENDGNIIKSKSKADNVIVDSQIHRGPEPLDNLVELGTALDVGNVQKLEKNEEEKLMEGKYVEAKDACNGQSIKLNTVKEGEPKMDNTFQDFPTGNGQRQGQAYDKDIELPGNVAWSSSEMDPVKCGVKRKKKEQVPKGSHFESDSAYYKEYNTPRDKAESDNVILEFPEGKDQDRQQNDTERGNDGTHNFPDANQSEDRKMKKRKKKNKSEANVEINESGMPQSSVEQNSRTMEEDENIMADAKPSEVKILSSGLVIQELEKGTEDGKIAASGRKVSVLYTGKLKDNEEVFESNVGHAPFKFRLGKGQVIEGWDVGLEGMRMGEKRRLIIPPSMGFGSEGCGQKIPPDSWLVYDFKLVKVH